MRGTVRRAVSDREVPEETKEVAAWVNKEAIPILREMRDVHGLVPMVGAASTSAGDAVAVPLWTSDPLPTDSVVQVEVQVIGRANSGPPQSVSYVRRATFVNQGGVVTQVGATVDVYTEETDAGYDVALTISGTSLVLTAQDDGVSPTAWTAKVATFSTPAK